MKRTIQSILLALAVLLFVPVSGDAQAGGRGGWHGGGGHGRGWHGGGGHGHGWRGGGYGHRYYGNGYGRGYYRYGYPRVAIGIGLPGFWWGAPYYAPHYGYGYGWYGPPGYAYAERPVYVQRPAPDRAAYWYYCESEGGYYPDVPDCPEEWIPVPPR